MKTKFIRKARKFNKTKKPKNCVFFVFAFFHFGSLILRRFRKFDYKG